ncbi:MAG: protein kinase [Planctomycetota bacterium]|nr:protein kinase [Planctomycetota bacterium]
MAIECPYCMFVMNVKGLRAGRFAPKCGKCQKPFRLIVADDAEGTMTVEPIEASPATGTTLPPPASAVRASAPPPDQTQAGPAALRKPRSSDSTAPPATIAAVGEKTAPPPPRPTTRPAPKPPAADVTAPSGISKPKPAPSADVTAPSGVGKAKPSNADITAPSGAGRAAASAANSSQGSVVRGDDDQISGTLGGYELIKRLGQGGMGAVYLARQVSLDRNVAVKTMNPEWANDATFVARFTREAYAAAQLTHHNVVQIYDIGAQEDLNFFSMEFVEGQSLGDLLKAKGRLDAEEAAGYVLQAARGLKFAHEQGMVHRDIKPDNLMLNKHGIVKVADLGLVKTPASVALEEEVLRIPEGSAAGVSGGSGGAAGGKTGVGGLLAKSSASSATRVDVAMGTPAYMAPEQARNAAGVDHRADIYSLGCTLYVLVTGRPVHEGDSAVEVMTKHQTEPIVPPDVVVSRVPKELSYIVQKMTAKVPTDRYQDMTQVCKALEEFLGVSSSGPFTPKEEHARTLEEGVKKFNGSKPAKLRGYLIAGFYTLCAALVLFFAMKKTFDGALYAAGFLGLAVLTTVSYHVIVGFFLKTHLFTKLRQWLFGASIADWAKVVGAVVLTVVVLWVFSFNLLLLLLGFLVVAVGIAVGFALVVDRMVSKDRKPQVAEVEEMLKVMRLRGLEEQALRQFVCKYAGERWEEFYEALFGYEAKISAREQWGKGDRGRMRKKHAAWRDTIINTLDARIRQRKEERERRHLQRIEEKQLKAKGMGEAEAKKKAQDEAQTMVTRGAEIKEKAARMLEEATLPPKKVNLAGGGGAIGDPEAARARARARAFSNSATVNWINFFIGPRARFVVGALLLVLFGLWIRANELTDTSRVRSTAGQGISGLIHMDTKPLGIPLVPETIRYEYFNGLGLGLAGIILVLSALFGRLRMAVLALPAAVLAFGAHALRGVIPPVLHIEPELIALAGAVVLATMGLVFIRR